MVQSVSALLKMLVNMKACNRLARLMLATQSVSCIQGEGNQTINHGLIQRASTSFNNLFYLSFVDINTAYMIVFNGCSNRNL